MFLLPSGPTAHTEGQDREHPIILEGYKKDEFSCLLKVRIYVLIIFIKLDPTYLRVCRASSLISSTTLNLCLGKEEWVSVLKLSTIWNMEKVCQSQWFPQLLNRLIDDIM